MSRKLIIAKDEARKEALKSIKDFIKDYDTLESPFFQEKYKLNLYYDNNDLIKILRGFVK